MRDGDDPAVVAKVIVAAATAVGGDRLHITDGGVPEPHDPKLQTARINFAALLEGAAH